MENDGYSRSIRRVGIIGGGGAAGLAVLRAFLGRPEFQAPHASWSLEAFEARDDIGGIWMPEKSSDEMIRFPSSDSDSGYIEVPPTPLYNGLTTNIPHPLMAYHGFPFPPSTPLYPRASVVLAYLRSYADHFGLRRHIQFNSRVVSLERDEANDRWELRLTDEPSGPSLYFDAIVLCQGRFKEPRFPNVPGLRDWARSKRESMHSIFYREPSGFRNQHILVVGAGPSGLDISTEISQTATLVLQSSTGTKRSDDKVVKQRARLVELRADNGSAHYEDGTSDLDLDAVVFATGYKCSFPFFPLLRPTGTYDKADPIPPHIFNSTYHIHPLARHLFPLRDILPSKLAFMSLLYKVAPFPAFEDQAQAIASVFLGNHPVDYDRERSLVRKRFELLSQRYNGNLDRVAKAWHSVPKDDPEIEDQYQYRADLLEISGDEGFPPPPPWNRDIYLQKNKLRPIWVDLEKRGLGEQIVKGVGEGGEHEWVDLMYRLLNNHTSITSVPQDDGSSYYED